MCLRQIAEQCAKDGAPCVHAAYVWYVCGSMRACRRVVCALNQNTSNVRRLRAADAANARNVCG